MNLLLPPAHFTLVARYDSANIQLRFIPRFGLILGGYKPNLISRLDSPVDSLRYALILL
jgi:hypothetical protein